jgi:hypothetical protein
MTSETDEVRPSQGSDDDEAGGDDETVAAGEVRD